MSASGAAAVAGTGWARPQYDLSSARDRFKYFLNITDVRKVLLTRRDLARARAVIAKYDAGKLAKSGANQRKLWEAYSVRDTMVHASSGQVIPAMFRRCYFVPICLPLFLGFVTAPNVNYVMFWQTVNQGYNTAMNWANRGSSSTSDISSLAGTFGAACAASAGVALFLDHRIAPLRSSAWASTLVGATAVRFVAPFASTVTAGSINVLITRGEELTQGIQVQDADGNKLGLSVRAGRDAVGQTLLSRVFIPLPGLLGPSFVQAVLTRYAPTLVNSRPKLIAWQVSVLACLLVFTLPMAMAPFPVFVHRPVDELEDHIQRAFDAHHGSDAETSDVDRTVTYYRGM